MKRRRNCHSLKYFPILDMFPRSGDIRDRSLKWSKMNRNFACFGPIFFGGGRTPPAEVLNTIYSTQPDVDHVAKFQGDPSRDLGENVAKKVTSRVKHKPVPGGLKSPSSVEYSLQRCLHQ